jgi:hypothetical protein
MSGNGPANRQETYVCYTCLWESVDPDVCTNCGAKIERVDVESIIVTPPKWGQYCVPIEMFAEETTLAAVRETIANRFKNFKTVQTSSHVEIVSNERAYDDLMEVLARHGNMPVEQVRKAIPFTASPEQ